MPRYARPIKAGDMIWAPAGTAHWDGADDGSIMTCFVIGLEASTHRFIPQVPLQVRLGMA
ncbi:hypothetical protein TSTA_006290 [Talaromyces stipitatus ATCC 10500]|uniref:Cupin type-1 domain-containing protein n=1 Tax=Talaromyces stipitatus (strain ATCC 10500 / CBS 375.48 / QM 6759 / NRRL 1006) TaxID=441959 RepID=B8MSS1_TALSN|nr:uncharacterized protein TSTA_006290 [Talaromyces stipitatus ATCC 10500]EED12603.1 hypothetical protein TSTA_006290 [Talaromyces stipitatus ATCC 10500]